MTRRILRFKLASTAAGVLLLAAAGCTDRNGSPVAPANPFLDAAPAAAGTAVADTSTTPAAATGDRAQLVSETYPDHSVVSAGSSFTKSWTFHNAGTTTWSGYRLAFKSYNRMSGPDSVAIPTTAPGMTVTASVSLRAPGTPTCACKNATGETPSSGGQNGLWSIRNASGAEIPGGAATVVITVNPPSGNLMPNLASSAYGSRNPFFQAGYGGQCTAFAWGRAQELRGIDLPMRGNAGSWYAGAAATPYTRGLTPAAHSIACWGNGNDGHVAYVEAVQGDRITMNEANVNPCYASGTWGGGYRGETTVKTSAEMASRFASQGWSFQGYIHLVPTALPDLTCSTSSPSSVRSGQTGVQVPVTVSRTGGSLSSGSYVAARLYWSSNSTLDPGDRLLWEANGSTPDFPVSTLNASGSRTVIATVSIPQAAAGTWYLIAIVDPPTSTYPSGFHAESKESNNQAVYPVSVTGTTTTTPVIRVVSPNGGETWRVGEYRTISWTASGLSPAGTLFLYYRLNGAWRYIGSTWPGSTSYTWRVPATPTSSTTVWIGNHVAGRWEASDESDRSFSIR